MSWQPPIPEKQNGKIVSYHVSVTEQETGQVFVVITKSTILSYVVKGLHPFYHYNCSVAAYTIGLGPSAHYVIQTMADGKQLFVCIKFIFVLYIFS